MKSKIEIILPKKLIGIRREMWFAVNTRFEL